MGFSGGFGGRWRGVSDKPLSRSTHEYQRLFMQENNFQKLEDLLLVLSSRQLMAHSTHHRHRLC